MGIPGGGGPLSTMTREEKAFQLLLVCPVGADCLEFDNPARIPVHERMVGKPCPTDPAERAYWVFSVIACYKMLWVHTMLAKFTETFDV